jgi:hypothetical protein
VLTVFRHGVLSDPARGEIFSKRISFRLLENEKTSTQTRLSAIVVDIPPFFLWCTCSNLSLETVYAQSAALTPRKEPPIPIVQEAGWVPEPFWTTLRREYTWSYRHSNSDPSVTQYIASRSTDCAVPDVKINFASKPSLDAIQTQVWNGSVHFQIRVASRLLWF